MRESRFALTAFAGILAFGCATPGIQTAAATEAAEEAVEAAPAAAPESITERVGDMRLEYGRSMGLRLHVFDIPVLNTSSLVVVKPGWTGTYYNSFNNMTVLDDVVLEDYEGGRRITVLHELSEEYESPFTATETITLLPNNTFHSRLEFDFRSDDPAVLEKRVGAFNPALVAGMPFRRVTGEEVEEGIVSYQPRGSTAAETTVALGFDELTIGSRIGDIVIESQPADNLILFDYRRHMYAEESNPMFWFGYLGRPIPEDGGIYEITMSFPESLSPASETVEPLTASSEPHATEEARVPGAPRDYIIPQPKELAYTGAEIPLNGGVVVYTGPDPGPGIETAAEFLVRDLREIYRTEARIVRGPAPADPPEGAILLGEAGRYAEPAEMLEQHGLSLPDHEEGYALRVGDRYATIAANTEQGVFFGVTTLLQLVGTGEDGVVLRGAEIVDWPSLDFRGIHALSGRDAGDQISKAVRELMARYKLNAFIWECQYIIWDNAPELEHPRFGMAKDDAQKVVEAADRYFVDLIPLIQSLGHSEWIFTGGHNLDIAEDPETPYAYMVTNPRTYEFIFTIFQEALDFFEPTGFHIGHDEVTMRGRFPYRSADSGMSVTDLIIKDIEKLNDWFREREVDVYMWGDMFLHSSEASDAHFAPSVEVAQERRERLPRDIIITDWHYATVEPEEFISIPLWIGEGFQTIGAGWYRPRNIKNLALACIQNDALGYLQTTWAGFNFAIDNNEAQWFQYWSYITAAHYAWSGDDTPLEDLPFVPKEEFLNTWFRTQPLLEKREGFHLDLRGAYNRSLVDEDGSGWLGFGPQNDFRNLPEGDVLLGETAFRLDRNEQGHGAIVLAGMMNPAGEFPEAVTLETGGVSASELRFLMTAAFPTREQLRAGTIEVHYADGEVESMPLNYGQQLFAFGDERAGGISRIAWEGESADGSPIRLWDTLWMNPHPEKEIEAVRVSSTGTEAAPVILAITGVK